MRRLGGLFEQAVSFEHLLRAYYKARRGTRKSARLCSFGFHLEKELLQLQQELREGVYRPRPYRHFEVRDPKHRLISVADFRDRVVHHSIVGVLEPMYERCFIYDSYATRKGKGAHAAVFRAQQFLRRNDWFLKTDIHKYFDSIRHDLLLEQLARKTRDKQLLSLIGRVLANGGSGGVGLPIGNLTSQFFANVYLNDFDHWVRGGLGAGDYVRYMDDFVVFGRDRSQMKVFRDSIRDWLFDRLSLRLKEDATFINGRDNGLSFLGTRIFAATVRLHPSNARRALRRYRLVCEAFHRGRLSAECCLQSQNSYYAYFSIYHTHRFRQQVFKD